MSHLEDNDRVLSRVLLQQRLEVGRAGGQDHLVRLAALPITGNRHVSERLLIPEVFEGGDHVGLEVVPSQAELLLVVHVGAGEFAVLVLVWITDPSSQCLGEYRISVLPQHKLQVRVPATQRRIEISW